MLVTSLCCSAMVLAIQPPATPDPAPASTPQVQPAQAPRAGEATAASVPTLPAPGATLRVGGEMDAKVKQEGENFYFGAASITTPLPVGYPAPTPPGAIDLKSYPSVRRAEVRGEMAPDVASNVAFFPLFRHIQRRNIEMTSPVEMDYVGLADGLERADHAPAADDEAPKGGSWTMSFLYRKAEQGPTGPDEQNQRVVVVDTAPVTMLAIGLRGPYSVARIRAALGELDRWLADHPQFEVAGEARAMYYNGPEKRNADKWAEAQLPVRLREVKPEAKTQP